MTQSVADLENTFAVALGLLARNWIIVVPGLVLGVIGTVLGFAILALAGASIAVGGVSGTESAGGVYGQLTAILTAIAAVLLAMLLLICEMAYVTGMAGAAWRTGKATLGDGWRAFEARGSQALVAVVLLFLAGLAAAALAPFTLLVSLAVYAVFSIYTMAAVIIGDRRAVDGIAESFRLARANFWPTVAVVALVVAIAFGGSWLGGWAGGLIGRFSPLLSRLVAALAQQIVVAYATLVVTGEYLKLRNPSDASAV